MKNQFPSSHNIPAFLPKLVHNFQKLDWTLKRWDTISKISGNNILILVFS